MYEFIQSTALLHMYALCEYNCESATETAWCERMTRSIHFQQVPTSSSGTSHEHCSIIVHCCASRRWSAAPAHEGAYFLSDPALPGYCFLRILRNVCHSGEKQETHALANATQEARPLESRMSTRTEREAGYRDQLSRNAVQVYLM